MRKFLALSLTLFLFVSCSVNDENINYNFEILPVESVSIPDAFILGETYPITVSYFKPSTCHYFKEFYSLKGNNTSTVAPINYVYEETNCEALADELVESTFNFTVINNGSYIFKFWQGENATGEDQYLTIEVPITN